MSPICRISLNKLNKLCGNYKPKNVSLMIILCQKWCTFIRENRISRYLIFVVSAYFQWISSILLTLFERFFKNCISRVLIFTILPKFAICTRISSLKVSPRLKNSNLYVCGMAFTLHNFSAIEHLRTFRNENGIWFYKKLFWILEKESVILNPDRWLELED